MKKIALVLSLALIMIFVSSCSAITSARSPKGSYVDFSMSDIEMKFERRVDSNNLFLAHVLTNNTKYPIDSYTATYRVSDNTKLVIRSGYVIGQYNNDSVQPKSSRAVQPLYYYNERQNEWFYEGAKLHNEAGDKTYLTLDQMLEIVKTASLESITFIFESTENTDEHSYTYYPDINEIIENY